MIRSLAAMISVSPQVISSFKASWMNTYWGFRNREGEENVTARSEMMHLIVIHMICAVVDGITEVLDSSATTRIFADGSTSCSTY